MKQYTVTNPSPGLWVLSEPGINLYLIAGRERAVLVDTGFGEIPVKELCQRLCPLPIELVHTHAHGDHTGGDREWNSAWIHPADIPLFLEDRGNIVELKPLNEGDLFDLGERVLEVVHLPGHSPGSIALLDRANRMIFSGDVAMFQPVFLFNPTCSVTDYLATLEKLEALSGGFDLIYPSHARTPVTPAEVLPPLLDCARRAAAGDQATLTEFDGDLGDMVVKFTGYVKDGCSVAMAPAPGADFGPPPKQK